ncbi:MAG: SDR family oxidoreductase [Pseudomonadota bacterium]
MTDARVTLITGASSGIGAATARRLAGPGEALLLTARGGEDGGKVAALEAVADEARSAGAEVATHIADLAIPGTAGTLVDTALEHFGRLDRLVSNAGFAYAGTLNDTPADMYCTSLQVIYHSFLDLVRRAEPALTSAPRGRIVNVSSFVVDQVPGGRAFPATAAAKGAADALARTLAVEFAPKGITVNSVAPGFTEKETHGHSALTQSAWDAAAALTPDGRLAKPRDVAAAIAFFLSDEAEHITGQCLRVDGGLSLV